SGVLRVIPAPSLTFDGINSTSGILPPDTNGDVGPAHYVQTTNSSTSAITAVGVFDKTTGALLAPAFSMATLFSSLGAGDPCAANDDGDPIVLYDSFADRWLISQFVIGTEPTRQCIAISQTGNPLGAYFAYDFIMPTDADGKLNDYPHFGVWSDAYYMTDNQFNTAGTAFEGGGIFAFDRNKMVAGDPTATYIYFDIFGIDPNAGGFLPTDADGVVPPPPGLNQLVMEFRADEFGDPIDALRMYEVVPNFAAPMSSTVTVRPDLALALFDARQPSGRGDIEQLGGAALDSLSDRLLHRLQYRNVGTLAVPQNRWTGNFGVNVSGVNPTSAATYQIAPRWFILQSAGTALPTVLDQGTHAPDAGNGATGANRWMASSALDNQGNLGIGFSRSSTTLRADIMIAGRLASDAPGSLVQGETVMFAAAGSQTSASNRWGDYSAMSVDPVDDCTFWYTQEYYSTVSGANWRTRIGRFVYPSCTAPQKGTVVVNVTNCSSGAPIQGATVNMTGGFVNSTNASGAIVSNFMAGPGAYTVTSSKTGFLSGVGSTAPAVVTNGGTTTVNVCLTGVAAVSPGAATISAESCTPANSALDPGETVTLSLCVLNSGTADTTAATTGTLQATGGVLTPSAPQNYGVIVSGGPAVCRNFTFVVDPALACGGSVTATLQIQDGATNLGNVVYNLITGTLTGPVVTNTFSYTGPAIAIPDAAPGITANVPVSGFAAGSQVTDVNFRFDTGGACTNAVGNPNAGLDHTWVGDIVINIAAPTGQNVTVIDRIGVPASTFGLNAENFCSVTLDDEGGFPPIENTVLNPVVGNFSPNNPLSGFDTVTAPNGTWVLTASDGAAGDFGSLRRFSLIIETTGRVCSTSCIQACALTCPANLSTNNDAGLCNATVNYPAPTSTGACGTISCTPNSGSIFNVGTTNVTCTDSGSAASCGFTVTVNDVEPPVVNAGTCPPIDVVGSGGNPVNYTPPSASDNCGPVAGNCTPPPGSIFPSGTTNVTCTFPNGTQPPLTCTFPLSVNGSVIDIPTLSGLGFGGLISLLAAAALIVMMRRRRSA
ncbi:MAG TPA: HYR domain-containing protein, partial [Thermoanaerobaculia bacterium]|nr:HYR domain-containing protein [Thermoanaerobaculia bacterium]